MGTRRSVLRGLGLVGLAAMSATPSYAADFPEKAVKIIVNFPPGGPLDVIARLVAARLTTTLKQSVVVENVSGASGNIGATQVARSSPDGHTTLMSIDTPFTMTLALYPDTSVKADELRPVAVMGVTGMKINPIHYRGNAPAVLAVVSCEVQAGILGAGGLLPNIKADKLKALAVASNSRSIGLSELPTALEQGQAGLDLQFMFISKAPAKTPDAVVNVLQKAIMEATGQADFLERMRGLDVGPSNLSGAVANERLTKSRERYAYIVKTHGPER